MHSCFSLKWPYFGKKNIMKQNKNILTQSNQMKFWQNKFLKAEDLTVIKFCKKNMFLLLDMAYAGPLFRCLLGFMLWKSQNKLALSIGRVYFSYLLFWAVPTHILFSVKPFKTNVVWGVQYSKCPNFGKISHKNW